MRIGKIKFTKAQLSIYQQDLQDFNRRMKRQGRHAERLTLEQYIRQRHGLTEQYQPKGDYRPSQRYVRQTRHIPSREDQGQVCARPERKVYTGTLVKGIATMHKSNAVPIIDQQQAEDIAKMRRG
jgi:hypothetical protein